MRADITMGSSGSSVPVMVIPRGPPKRCSSTVYVIQSSCPSSTHEKKQTRIVNRKEGNVIFNDALNTF